MDSKEVKLTLGFFQLLTQATSFLRVAVIAKVLNQANLTSATNAITGNNTKMVAQAARFFGRDKAQELGDILTTNSNLIMTLLTTLIASQDPTQVISDLQENNTLLIKFLAKRDHHWKKAKLSKYIFANQDFTVEQLKLLVAQDWDGSNPLSKRANTNLRKLAFYMGPGLYSMQRKGCHC